MKQPSAKRRRIDEQVEYAPPPAPLLAQIDQWPGHLIDPMQHLDQAAMERVINAALSNPTTAPWISHFVSYEYNADVIRERRKLIDFDHHSKSVWHVINTKYSRSSQETEYELANDEASHEIADAMYSIQCHAREWASFGTRRNALITLRKIGKSIILSEGVCARQVRFQFQSEFDGYFDYFMKAITQATSEPEREAMCNVDNGEFVEKMEELVTLAEQHNVFDRLHDVLTILTGINIDTEEDDDEDDEEDEEDEDEDEENDDDDDEEVYPATHDDSATVAGAEEVAAQGASKNALVVQSTHPIDSLCVPPGQSSEAPRGPPPNLQR